jgi:hypothetical protein
VKLLDINWQQFLDSLAKWHETPLDERALLFRAGAADTGPGIGQQQPFARVMRALYANPLHEAPSRRAFDDYLTTHFTPNEKFAFGARGEGNLGAVLFKQVAGSGSWAERFAKGADLDWEDRYLAFGQRRYMASQTVLAATRQIVAEAGRNGPLALLELRERSGGAPPAVLGSAIQAALRYMLLFASLRHDDLEPVIGLWPQATPAAQRARVYSAVEVNDAYHEAFLLEDMTEALTACAAEPFRVRGDLTLYAKDWNRFGPALAGQPAWVSATFGTTPASRSAAAVSFLRAAGFAEVRFQTATGRSLTVTERGMAWLALSPKARLQELFSFLRARLDGQRTPGPLSEYFLPFDAAWPSYLDLKPSLAELVAEAFARIPEGQFVTVANVLEVNSHERNALFELAGRRDFRSLRIGRQWVSADEDGIEHAWHSLLSEFLMERLLPLGGVKVGVGPKKQIGLMVTPAGRYLLTGKGDFEYGQIEAAEIVVQPNFDVVFLAPAAGAEAQIARFAERKGRKVGVLFHINKKSILAAAAAGQTAEQVLNVLRGATSRDVPANVEREIRGWFGVCRRVTLRAAFLIECPDKHTAMRVLAAARGKARALSETVLELDSEKDKSAIARKLRDSGIFL